MHNLRYLPDVLILLGVSIFIVVFLKRLRLSPVLGYLVAGLIIGEHGFDIIKEPKYTQNFAEFGVIFLLFVIGLELTFERLLKMRLHVFGFGGLQLVLTGLTFFYIFYYWMDFSLAISILVSSAISLSSTAIVLQVLQESRRNATQVGRLSLSVLLMQDFAVVPLLAILPIIAGGNEDILPAIGLSTVKALGVIVLFTLAGRVFINPIFTLIGSAKSDDIYVPTTLLIVLGAAMITNSMGLSTAMGAFLAGLLIAETEYRNRVEHSIMPFKSLFLGLFFMTVGMSIDINFIIENLKNVFLAAFGLIMIKAFIIFILCRIFRFPYGASLHSALLLSQGGEFAFILFDIAYKRQLINEELSQFLLMVVAISMAVTPLLSMLGAWVEDRFSRIGMLDSSTNEYKGISDLESHVIIAGFGRVGKIVAYILSQEQIPYVAVDANSQLVKKAQAQGYPVYQGESTDIDTFKSVGAARAKCVIITVADRPAVRKTVKILSKNFDKIKIIARAEDLKHGKGLKKLGSSISVPATIETGLQLGGALLQHLGVAEHEIMNIKEIIRKDDYMALEDVEK